MSSGRPGTGKRETFIADPSVLFEFRSKRCKINQSQVKKNKTAASSTPHSIVPPPEKKEAANPEELHFPLPCSQSIVSFLVLLYLPLL